MLQALSQISPAPPDNTRFFQTGNQYHWLKEAVLALLAIPFRKVLCLRRQPTGHIKKAWSEQYEQSAKPAQQFNLLTKQYSAMDTVAEEECTSTSLGWRTKLQVDTHYFMYRAEIQIYSLPNQVTDHFNQDLTTLKEMRHFKIRCFVVFTMHVL